MGYRVVYKPVNKCKQGMYSSGVRIILLTVLFWCIFVYGVSCYSQESREVLLKLFWPEMTQQAVQTLIEELRTGYPVFDAIESFCREIVQRAY